MTAVFTGPDIVEPWDKCLLCAQLGFDEPSIYDAFAAQARHQGRSALDVARDFFRRYHQRGHNRKDAA